MKEFEKYLLKAALVGVIVSGAFLWILSLI